MRVTTVGSGDAFGSGGRFQTCIALAPEAAEAPSVLLDCGATSLTALRQVGFDPNQIATVVISHLHGDHFGGLPFLVLDGQFRHRTRDLSVLGPPGTARRLQETMETLFPGSSTVRRRFTVNVFEHNGRRPFEIDGLKVIPFEVRHASGAPAYALRVQAAGVTVTYSGDTEWTDELLPAADGADLFLCEGYSPTPVRWHLNLDDLASHRDNLGCGQLILTHLSPSALNSDLSGWDVAHDSWTLHL